MKKQAFNPYLPSWEYVPDGEPYVFGDRVYVYGSHDFFNGYVFCMGDYVCWSAPADDLGNWRYEGVIYPRNEDPLNRDGRMCLYAPDVTVGPDGRYYLYYVLDKVNVVSVAVCDTPAGKYSFYGYVRYPDGTRLGEKEGDEPQFDPGVLTENGETFMYTGFCGRGMTDRHGAMLTVLGEDMLTIKKAPEIVVPGVEYEKGSSFEGHAYFEAASIRKHAGKYYFVYSSTPMHELCYAVSDSPCGKFVYGGVLVSNCDLHTGSDPKLVKAAGGNNHGSIIEIGGQWYVFYHRQTNCSWFCRQGCAEPISIAADGSIAQAELTSCGLNGKPLEGRGEYPAYIACHLFKRDIDEPVILSGEHKMPFITQDGRDGDENVGYIDNITDKTVIGFRYFDFDNVGRISIWTRAYINGKFLVRTSIDGEVLAELPVEGTNVWERSSSEVRLDGEKTALYLEFTGSGRGMLRSVAFE